MSEKSKTKAIGEDQFSDILLVFDTNKKKVEAVKGIGKDKELQTVVPDKKR
jgi:hypothetical protein